MGALGAWRAVHRRGVAWHCIPQTETASVRKIAWIAFEVSPRMPLRLAELPTAANADESVIPGATSLAVETTTSVCLGF